MRLTIEKRRTTSGLTSFLIGLVAVVLALLISGIVLAIMGYNPFHIFGTAYSKTYLTWAGISECIVSFVPLSLCALCVAVGAKAGLWNIGVDGQFYVGAIIATGVALTIPDAPGFVQIILMILLGGLGAGIFCYLAVLPKLHFGISEILTTTLLNSVVLYFVRWIVYSSSWKDSSTIAAQSRNISPQAELPILVPGTRLHLGVIICILIIIAIRFYLKRTVPGFELQLVGSNARGAKYSGIDIKKTFIIAMILSGAMAGTAGALEISGVTHRLQATISADYGYSAFAIAWVTRGNIYAIAGVSFLFAGLLVAGYKMQMMSLPYAVTTMLEGLILVLVLAGDLLCYYHIGIKRDKKGSGAAVAAQEA